MHCVSATTVAIVNIEKRGEDMNVKNFKFWKQKKYFLCCICIFINISEINRSILYIMVFFTLNFASDQVFTIST